MDKNILHPVHGIVIQGHRIASGTSDKDRRFPDGSIAMQAPFFRQQGLDLAVYFGGDFYRGTLNVSIAPLTYDILQPEYFMRDVKWTDALPAENFYLSPAALSFKGTTYKAMIYIPDPATKVDHFNPPTMFDVIAEPVPGINYGDDVALFYNPAAFRLHD